MRLNKISTILKREYLLVTRKKLFWIVSIAGPLAYLLLMVGVGFMVGGAQKGQRIRIYDGAGLGDGMREEMAKQSLTVEVLPYQSASTPTAALENREVDAIIVIPPELKSEPADAPAEAKAETHPAANADIQPAAKAGEHPAGKAAEAGPHAVIYTRKGGNMQVLEIVSHTINTQLRALWLSGRGLDAAAVKTVFGKQVEITQKTVLAGGKIETGSQLGGIIICIFSLMLLTVPSLIWGMELMRSIIEEKNQRIVEILISSLTPFELLTGKLLGIGLVGLTQLGIWLVLFAGISIAGLSALPLEVTEKLNLGNLLHPMMLPVLLIFFVLAFLMYSLPFAAVGSAVNSEKEAQQFVTPISLLMMLPMMMLSAIIIAPDAPRVVWMSMIPIYSPALLMMRYALGTLPWWQGVIGITLTLLTLYFSLRICSKIYRVGILMYGQKPSLAEIVKWIGRA